MYYEIFQEVVSITHHDYSGCLDKKGWDNPEQYLKEIRILEEKKELTPTKFVEIVQDYLLDYKDHHMYFKLSSNSDEKRYDIGFKVRRFDSSLFITEVGKETRVKKGQAIVSLDNIPILDLVNKHKRTLLENTAERERWSPILEQYNFCELVDENGHKSILELKKFEKDPYIPKYTIEKLEEKILLMTLTDFSNPDAIVQLLNEYKEELDSCIQLIIDVRVNYGGSDSSYFSLLPYIFEDRLVNLNLEDGEHMLINCTERTYELETKYFKDALSEIEDEETRKIYSIFMREWEKNRGKGFVQFDFSDIEENTVIQGRTNPKDIIVLTDTTCGSSGDSFVEICKRSSKVTVIGRPTAGLNDYANLAIMKWNDLFELWYPTSRLSRIDKGEGMTGVGIKPNIYIPWTPKHIFEDIDLQEGIKLLDQKNRSYI
ncbi:S41 family peptidase [Heyndrickxia sp. NPDC080065]|uniref:S41 family peptidase n=1 Tax=Heyndrickxia sp. NPDC080065 TaxID=3390568 RepID=UPI003CFE156D